MDCAVCQKPAGNKCSACKNVSYCSVECQKKDWKLHKKSCCPFAIKMEDDGTEYFEAARDLPVGTIIFDETPVFQVPWNMEMVKCCLSCSLPIQKEAKYQKCSKCGWRICSLDCEKFSIHRDNECEFLSSNKIKYLQWLEGDDLISTGSRGLMIKRNNKELWEYFQSLGIDSIEVSPVERYDDSLNRLMLAFERRTNAEKSELKEAFEIGRKLEALLYKCGFPRLLAEYSVKDDTPNTGNVVNIETEMPRERGFYLYKKALKMTHSCSPNLNWHIGDYPDFKIRVRAIVPIKKGEKLALSRLNAGGVELMGTISRSESLMGNCKFFCKCPRCLSPSEFESYFSAIRCDSCFLQDQDQKKKENASKSKLDDDKTEENVNPEKNDDKTEEDVNSGYLLPVDPMTYEKDGHFYLWKCNRCQKTTPYTKFLNKMKEIEKEINAVCDQNNFSVDSAKQYIEKYQGNFLHPNHYYFYQINLIINDYYSRLALDEKSLSNLEYLGSSDFTQFLAQMEEGIRRCDFLLRIVDKILPGLSYEKGKVLASRTLMGMRATLKVFLGAPVSTNVFEMKQVYIQEFQRWKEGLQQTLDFFEGNLPSHRGQQKCGEYNFFKVYHTLKSL